jgi:dihydrofolate reductase
MGKVGARITMSLDGFVAGPNDGPGRGLGKGGERLQYWVFGGPWSYEEPPTGEATGVDKELVDEFERIGAVIGGRWTYEAAEAWGGTNPWGVPFFILTHRPEDEPDGARFRFVNGLDQALELARGAAEPKDVGIMGGAVVIRQALAAGHVDELVVSVAPVVLGSGKRLFEGFDKDVELEQVGVVQSPWVTHLRYSVLPA